MRRPIFEVYSTMFLIGTISSRLIPRLRSEEIFNAAFVCPDLNAPPPVVDEVLPLRPIVHPDSVAIGIPSEARQINSSQAPNLNANLPAHPAGLEGDHGECSAQAKVKSFFEQAGCSAPKKRLSGIPGPSEPRMERVAETPAGTQPEILAQHVTDQAGSLKTVVIYHYSLGEPTLKPLSPSGPAVDVQSSSSRCEPEGSTPSRGRNTFVAQDLYSRSSSKRKGDHLETNGEAQKKFKQVEQTLTEIQKGSPLQSTQNLMTVYPTSFNTKGSSPKSKLQVEEEKALDIGQQTSNLDEEEEAASQISTGLFKVCNWDYLQDVLAQDEETTLEEPTEDYRAEWVFEQLNRCKTPSSREEVFWIPRSQSESFLEIFRRLEGIFPANFDDDIRREAVGEFFLSLAEKRLALSKNIILKDQIIKPMREKMLAIPSVKLTPRRMNRIDKIVRYIEIISTMVTFLIISYLTLFNEHEPGFLRTETVDNLLNFIKDFWTKVREQDSDFLDGHPWAKVNIEIMRMTSRIRGEKDYTAFVYQKRCQMAHAWHILEYWVEINKKSKSPHLCSRNSRNIYQIITIIIMSQNYRRIFNMVSEKKKIKALMQRTSYKQKT
ncbi:hypothetical protein PGT21_025297 [Puccinia graminis f. sp. tritici]|uniref:Uncharacterized protein n=2 Tax=Puccinia graminis f. sp. tritici TaxID=56615 RepID=E3KNS7_PUCGT|nr:uncharacterized protein PGTG_11708 [Puccinia graminis f. sp. tritici CRL 75-36-700-3]EFP85952.2 hypothetical protein PGTG_11708 [Puccinia graminis f. sp. tritici CRL 75-36-700-3]KAA1073776.1 hypothetical protein PGT21_025297 [Puccinia graminis f. sp. tritici]